MSTTIGNLQPTLPNLLVALALLGLAVVVAVLAGAHKVRSVRGPLRGAPHANGQLILGVGVLGYAAWIIASIVLVAMMVPQPVTSASPTRPQTQPATTPALEKPAVSTPRIEPSTAPTTVASTTQPQRRFSREQLAAAGVLSAIIAILTLRLLDHRLGLGGWGNLGLRESQAATAIVPMLVGSLCAIPGTIAISFLVQMGFAIFQEQPQVTPHELLVTLSQSSSWAVRLLIILSAVVVAPLFEELLFRGYFQTGLVRMGLNRWAAIVIVSLGFAAIHQTLWMMPPIFFLSVCLGYAYERTGNLWVPIAMHAVFNGLNVSARLFS